MTNIDHIFKKELSSSSDSVIKLRNLNKHPVLNSYLANKQYKEIVKTVIQIIEDGTETANNVDVLKFYLHELGLIFNLNIENRLLKGVV